MAERRGPRFRVLVEITEGDGGDFAAETVYQYKTMPLERWQEQDCAVLTRLFASAVENMTYSRRDVAEAMAAWAESILKEEADDLPSPPEAKNTCYSEESPKGDVSDC